MLCFALHWLQRGGQCFSLTSPRPHSVEDKQQMMRAQLKPSSYQLQLLDLYRVLELGLTLQGTCKFKSTIRKKKILTSEQGMLSTFLCFCKSKRVGFCCHYHRKPNWFFCLPSGCLISSAFTSQLFRWGPVAE